MFKIWSLFLLTSFLTAGCGSEDTANNNENSGIEAGDLQTGRAETVDIPDFNEDSAYHFIDKQVSFGPRVPNTEGHEKCGDYLYEKLSEYADEVIRQETRVRAFDGTPLNIMNIEATLYPEYEERILLCAHWDTRPYADFADDPDRRMEPIPGANDGGSGVGVLLELARILKDHDPGVGIDIVLFDAEDYGVPHFKSHEYHDDDSWGLGSQYWSRNLDREHKPEKGILLDMVGATGSRFLYEGYSMQYASAFTREVWENAHQLGHSRYFIKNRTIPITDDHYYVNTIAGIPTINIIDHDQSTRQMGFGDYWHTHDDDMDIISKRTLNAVGETVLKTIFTMNK